MSITRIYNQFTANDLRMLLTYLDIFDKEVAGITSELSQNQNDFKKINQAELSWAQFYEMPFEVCLGAFFVLAKSTSELQSAASAENKLQALNEVTDGLDSKLDSVLDSLNLDDQKSYVAHIASLSFLFINSLRSLMVYGQYINELIKVSRESSDLEIADRAFLQAIRIDPTVLGCPTGLKRISRAIFFNDAKFLNKIKNALSRKLGIRESKNYRKIRFILQVLHESGGVNLSDLELKDLFVTNLKIYSDSQSSSQKNLKELAYNFKKRKSTI